MLPNFEQLSNAHRYFVEFMWNALWFQKSTVLEKQLYCQMCLRKTFFIILFITVQVHYSFSYKYRFYNFIYLLAAMYHPFVKIKNVFKILSTEKPRVQTLYGGLRLWSTPQFCRNVTPTTPYSLQLESLVFWSRIKFPSWIRIQVLREYLDTYRYCTGR